ncbi:hypothetical protein F5H01DRAFT_347261 [Linnemannia elongata]|nr:hypothetical protein F5H01DRAFT_347261 [Linnemannia elongata]
MQTTLLLQALAAVCTCVARTALFNSTLDSTLNSADVKSLVLFELVCSDDPLGYACRHACSCSQVYGRLLCPSHLPGTEVPGTHCSSEQTPSYAD